MKEVEHLKYQISGLNELMVGTSNEFKQLSTKSKEDEEGCKRLQIEWEEKLAYAKQEFEREIRELKKTEENKYLTLTTSFIRKEKDFEDAVMRE